MNTAPPVSVSLTSSNIVTRTGRKVAVLGALPSPTPPWAPAYMLPWRGGRADPRISAS